MNLINCEQGTEEWFSARMGKITASNFHTVMGKGITRDNILLDKAAEILTGVMCKYSQINNRDIERGHALEADARKAYEQQTCNDVTEIGFASLNDYVGASPDGLVGEDGLIEIKCPRQKGFLDVVIGGAKKINPKYKTQMQFQMYVLDRQWCDFVAYNTSYDNHLHIIRVERDVEQIEKIKVEIERAKLDIASILNKFNKEMES